MIYPLPRPKMLSARTLGESASDLVRDDYSKFARERAHEIAVVEAPGRVSVHEDNSRTLAFIKVVHLIAGDLGVVLPEWKDIRRNSSGIHSPLDYHSRPRKSEFRPLPKPVRTIFSPGLMPFSSEPMTSAVGS